MPHVYRSLAGSKNSSELQAVLAASGGGPQVVAMTLSKRQLREKLVESSFLVYGALNVPRTSYLHVDARALPAA